MHVDALCLLEAARRGVHVRRAGLRHAAPAAMQTNRPQSRARDVTQCPAVGLEIAEVGRDGVTGGRVSVCGTERVWQRERIVSRNTAHLCCRSQETNRATFRSALHPPRRLLLYTAILSSLPEC